MSEQQADHAWGEHAPSLPQHPQGMACKVTEQAAEVQPCIAPARWHFNPTWQGTRNRWPRTRHCRTGTSAARRRRGQTSRVQGLGTAPPSRCGRARTARRPHGALRKAPQSVAYAPFLPAMPRTFACKYLMHAFKQGLAVGLSYRSGRHRPGSRPPGTTFGRPHRRRPPQALCDKGPPLPSIPMNTHQCSRPRAA